MRKHWSVDEESFKKNYPEKYRLWKLVDLINNGLGGEKLDKKEVKKVWPKIKDEIDPYKKRLIEYLIWGKIYSLPLSLYYFNCPRCYEIN